MVAMTGGHRYREEHHRCVERYGSDIALELGGKSPNIVFGDVDVDDAVKWARWAFTLNAGQVCVSGTRLILHKSIYDEFWRN